MDLEYLRFYNDEQYLLGEVSPRFRQTGILEPADFFTILIWKAERAKNRHRKRLIGIGGSYENAVREIAAELHQGRDNKHRLEVLMNKWAFLLPTASAILTILYPDEFTVYDWRVCDELGCEYKPWCSGDFSDALWDNYMSFKRAVIGETPSGLSLRDKDRLLIAHSTRKSILAALGAQV